MSTQRQAVPQSHPLQTLAEGQTLAPAQTGGAPTTRRLFLGRLASGAAALAVADGARGTRTAQGGPAAVPQPPGGTYAPLSVRALRHRRNAAFQMRVDRA